MEKAGVSNEKAVIQDVIQEVQTSGVVVITDREGKIKGYIASDTLLSTLLESYQYSQAYFQTMIDTIDGSVSIVDAGGKLLFGLLVQNGFFSIPKRKSLEKT